MKAAIVIAMTLSFFSIGCSYAGKRSCGDCDSSKKEAKACTKEDCKKEGCTGC